MKWIMMFYPGRIHLLGSWHSYVNYIMSRAILFHSVKLEISSGSKKKKTFWSRQLFLFSIFCFNMERRKVSLSPNVYSSQYNYFCPFALVLLRVAFSFVQKFSQISSLFLMSLKNYMYTLKTITQNNLESK